MLNGTKVHQIVLCLLLLQILIVVYTFQKTYKAEYCSNTMDSLSQLAFFCSKGKSQQNLLKFMPLPMMLAIQISLFSFIPKMITVQLLKQLMIQHHR